jgi:hypothetical protein
MKVEMMASCYCVMCVIHLLTLIVLVLGGKYPKAIGTAMVVDLLLWDPQVPRFKVGYLIRERQATTCLIDNHLL